MIFPEGGGEHHNGQQGRCVVQRRDQACERRLGTDGLEEVARNSFAAIDGAGGTIADERDSFG